MCLFLSITSPTLKLILNELQATLKTSSALLTVSAQFWSLSSRHGALEFQFHCCSYHCQLESATDLLPEAVPLSTPIFSFLFFPPVLSRFCFLLFLSVYSLSFFFLLPFSVRFFVSILSATDLLPRAVPLSILSFHFFPFLLSCLVFCCFLFLSVFISVLSSSFLYSLLSFLSLFIYFLCVLVVLLFRLLSISF